ncbi:MAG: galactose mutarotase [Muribaculaceae bacterium]|nr:galactose mutarotase [Muribaculaceae bacterium]
MKIATKTLMAGGLIALMTACASGTKEVQLTKSGLDPEKFLTDSTALYTLTNANGMEVCITNYGGRIVSIMVPGKDGNMHDVVFGFDSIQDYFPENNATDFGAVIGRYANRINQGRIVINGDSIQLPQNNYGHCLHGGPNGWQYSVYAAEQPNDSTLVLSLVSPDGDSNFPGTVAATTTYTLTSDNAIDIAYTATTDATTVINMTNHSYFNLNGNPDQLITDNILYVNADYFTPVDSTFMTTGEIAPVAGTPMDFTQPKVVGLEINNYEYDQLNNGKGYDHNWVLNTKGDDTTVAATLVSPTTGIQLDVLTNEPGIQVYAGNFLDGTVTGKGGKVYNQRSAICLETQHYPDSPNKPEWPSVILEPGQTYNSHCVFRFSTVND